MQKLAHCLGIDQALTPVYHPQANMVERKNRDLKAQLAIFVGGNHSSWPDKLPSIRFAMNCAQCSSTGCSAAYLTFGRELRTPDDAHRDLRAIVTTENFVPVITPKLLALADTLREARERQEMQQDRRKEYVDKHRRPGPSYKTGDKELVETHTLSNANKGISSKLAPRYDGPYTIKKKVGPCSYMIARNDGSEIVGTYHSSAIRRFQGDDMVEPVIPLRRRGRPRKGAD